MRNGNHRGEPVVKKNTQAGSYPTYEEWKPANALRDYVVKQCSYPTYEEWKPG